LQKVATVSGTATTTDYIGAIVYIGNVRKFIQTEVGRIVLETGTPEYQYNITDHLGNVRVTFTSASGGTMASTYMATMESEYDTLETTAFDNITETRQIDVLNNHTPGGKASARLNAAEGKTVGPSLSLHVMYGDTVEMKTYGKYYQKSSTKEVVDGLAGIVAGMLSSKGIVTETTGIAEALSGGLGTAEAGLMGDESGVPMAHLNYLFFDKDMKFKKGGFERISEAGNGKYEELSLSFIPEEEGYLMVYTSNQTAEDLNVFFDDLTVSHSSGPIVRVDDYYPFGLTFNTSTLSGVLTNKYLYNGKEFQDELSLNWFDYGARMYDATVGRWWAIDPMAEKSRRYSPYCYVYNNPLIFTDPDGMIADMVQGRRDANPWEDYEKNQLESHYDHYYIPTSLRWGAKTAATNYDNGGGAQSSQDGEEKTDDTSNNGGGDEPQEDGGSGQKAHNGGASSDPIGYDGINPFQIAWGVNGLFQMGTEIAVHGPKPKYTGPGDWAKQVKLGKNLTKKLGVVGIGITITDAAIQGHWQNHHTADVAIGVGTTFLIASNPLTATLVGGYFLIDIGVQIYSGRSITEHLFDPKPSSKTSN
jgi:RHS repeat-associated protein